MDYDYEYGEVTGSEKGGKKGKDLSASQKCHTRTLALALRCGPTFIRVSLGFI